MLHASERELTSRLQIPEDAERVLILGETSHWDPNWLHTADEYYERRIAQIFAEVIEELEADPRRVFTVESIFFLRMHYERAPQHREALRRLVAERRLRFSGPAITTPDTVLPSTEAILRDFLLGQEWLRNQGFEQEPRLAYLPDDFGYSPALPGILCALGLEQAVITRIDGMHFVGCDYRLPSAYPLPGSSAQMLEKELKTSDFVWRGPDGSEVLTHWNAFTYFQGDMIAYRGVIRWMGRCYGVPWRTSAHVAKRVEEYVRQLSPLARTRYLFCPIGCDFNGPIPGLMDLVDRYNREVYPNSGTYLLNTGLDEYLDLLEAHRGQLPVIALDPNPYWMGFYATRPEAKAQASRTARKLVVAEAAGVEASLREGRRPTPDPRVHEAWEHLAVSNHHDFITGTSPDRVWELDQAPVLARAEALADEVLGPIAPPARVEPADARIERAHRQVKVRVEPFELVFDEVRGGSLVSLRLDGREWLRGPGLDLVAYRDSGGLWRLGHEFAGGVFREVARSSAEPAAIEVVSEGGGVTIRVQSRLLGATFERRVHVRPKDPVLRFRIEGRPPEGHTVTAAWPVDVSSDKLHMNVPGGRITRPRHKLYEPTFWCARSLAHVHDARGGVAVFLGGPAAVSLGADGVLEHIVTRDARREMAFGVLPVLAHPARGSQRTITALVGGLRLLGPGDAAHHGLPMDVTEVLDEGPWAEAPRFSAFLTSDDPRVTVGAVKPADRGNGVVVRLHRHDSAVDQVNLSCAVGEILAAWRCDALERDAAPLHVEGGEVVVPLARALTSVRLRFR